MSEQIESDVEIPTADGVCNAAFFNPGSGAYPGVIIWPDAFGLRPATRDMGKRLATQGYAVLVPNPFYRVAREISLEARTFDFQKEADMAKLRPLMGAATAPGQLGLDAAAVVALL